MDRKSTQNKKELFLKHYASSKFNISKTSKAVGINRRTFNRWMEKDTDFAEQVMELVESQTDKIEDKLLKLAKGFKVKLTTTKTKQLRSGKEEVITIVQEKYYPPNFSAIKLFLEAKARHRGYGMKLDNSDAEQYQDQDIVFTDEWSC